MKQLLTIALLALMGWGNATAQIASPAVRAKTEAAVKKYLSSKLEKGVVLNTVRVLRVDSLTERKNGSLRLGVMLAELEHELEVLDLQMKLVAIAKQKMELNAQTFGADDVLTRIAVDDLAKERKKMEVIEARCAALEKEMMRFHASVEKMNDKALTGYLPTVFVKQVVAKSGVAVTDTLRGIRLDKSFFVMSQW